MQGRFHPDRSAFVTFDEPTAALRSHIPGGQNGIDHGKNFGRIPRP